MKSKTVFLSSTGTNLQVEWSTEYPPEVLAHIAKLEAEANDISPEKYQEYCRLVKEQGGDTPVSYEEWSS